MTSIAIATKVSISALSSSPQPTRSATHCLSLSSFSLDTALMMYSRSSRDKADRSCKSWRILSACSSTKSRSGFMRFTTIPLLVWRRRNPYNRCYRDAVSTMRLFPHTPSHMPRFLLLLRQQQQGRRSVQSFVPCLPHSLGLLAVHCHVLNVVRTCNAKVLLRDMAQKVALWSNGFGYRLIHWNFVNKNPLFLNAS